MKSDYQYNLKCLKLFCAVVNCEINGIPKEQEKDFKHGRELFKEHLISMTRSK